MENYVVRQSRLLLKRSEDNVSLDWSAYVTPSCDCSVREHS